jgi:hypothetical protein
MYAHLEKYRADQRDDGSVLKGSVEQSRDA